MTRSLEERVDELERDVRALRTENATMRIRIDMLEESLDPPKRVEVVRVPDPKALGAAMDIGGQLSELRNEVAGARKDARGAKDSARAIRRIVAPEDDTGVHHLPDRKESKT